MRLDDVKITFPIVESRESEFYALIFLDSSNVEHYFNFDGTYDGYSCNTCIDPSSGINLN